MKKKFALFLALALVLSLAACGSPSDGEGQTPSDDAAANSPEPTAGGGEETAGQQEADISETVLVDEAGVKITAKGLEYGALFGTNLKLLIENSSGTDLTFQCRGASVNGYMVEPMMSVDVADGKKANDALTFMRADLELCGISDIADMEFSFHIFGTESWETYLDTPPIQLKTSIADTYQYTFDDSGELVYDGDGVKVVVKGLNEDSSILGPSIVVFIENSSGTDVTVQARDVSINGFMMEPIFSSEVAKGKRALDTITFMSSELEDNGITAIETAELSFHIFETDGWETIADTEPITLTF